MNQEDHNYKFEKDHDFDEYIVIAPLGRGRFSEVYHCQNKVGRHVTVKLFVNDSDNKHDQVANNYKVLGEHQNLLHMLHYGSIEGAGYIVFDYKRAITLAEYIREHPNGAPFDESTLEIFEQIAEVLDYAHKKKIIHRDIKPSNILLANQRGTGKADSWHVYLIDFGLAIHRNPDELALSTYVSPELAGTLAYMAPECFLPNGKQNELSDYYSLGTVVYQMITGHLPYDRNHKGQLTRITNDVEVTSRSAILEQIGPVLLKMVNPNPEERYTSATDFCQALRDASEQYIEAEESYKRSEKFMKEKNWGAALEQLNSLPKVLKNSYKDVPIRIQWLTTRIGLDKLHEGVEQALRDKRFQDAINTVKHINDIDPEANTSDLSNRVLDNWYQEAYRLFREEDYLSAAKMLNGILEVDDQYPDSEGIRKETIIKADELKTIDQSLEETKVDIDQGNWSSARRNLDYVLDHKPDETIRLLAQLIILLDEASSAFEHEDFVTCVNKLDELKQRDNTFQAEYRTKMHEKAISHLIEQANSLLEQDKYEESILISQALADLVLDSTIPESLEQRAKEGIRLREVKEELDGYLARASLSLERSNYEGAAEQCAKIINRQEETGYVDYEKLENILLRVTQGLYDQAANYLNEPYLQPERAIDILDLILSLDPDFNDGQRVRDDAQAVILERDNNKKRRTIIVTGIVAIAFVITFLAIGWAFLTTSQKSAELTSAEAKITQVSSDAQATFDEFSDLSATQENSLQNELSTANAQVLSSTINLKNQAIISADLKASRDAAVENLTEVIESGGTEEAKLNSTIESQTSDIESMATELTNLSGTATYEALHVSMWLRFNTTWGTAPGKADKGSLFATDVIVATGKYEDENGTLYYKIEVFRNGEWEDGWVVGNINNDDRVSFTDKARADNLPFVTPVPIE